MGTLTMSANARIFGTHSKVSSAVAAVVVLIVIFSATGCDKLKARDLLNQGVASFRNGKYDESIEAFKQAKEDDPSLLNARLYLATAYATEYIPGAPSDENIRVGNQAITEFQDVLSVDPGNLSAIDGIGSIVFQMAGTPFTPDKFEESKKYHMKHISLSPNDPDPYYWVGVIDWTLAYRADAEMRQMYNSENPKKQIKDADPLPDKLRAGFEMQYGMLVDEGLQMLDKAVTLRPDYADAMAYQSLLMRQKADMSDSATRAGLEKQADDLLDKVKEIKQKAAETATNKS
jgi:tetratricopeptide (TPR) repeat protein